MRLSYTIPAEASLAFHRSFVRDIRRKVLPGWVDQAATLAIVAATFVISVWLSTALERAVAIWLLFWIILVIGVKGMEALHRKLAVRYIKSLPNSELWTAEVGEGRFSVESRGLRYSFPISSFTRVYEKDDCLCFEFSTLGVTRVHFTAFQTISERCEFARMVEEMKLSLKNS